MAEDQNEVDGGDEAQHQHLILQFPDSFRSPLAWAGAIIGTALACIILFTVWSISVQVQDFGACNEDPEGAECIDYLEQRVGAMTPDQACTVIEKAEAQMILQPPRSTSAGFGETVVLDIRCPDESN